MVRPGARAKSVAGKSSGARGARSWSLAARNVVCVQGFRACDARPMASERGFGARSKGELAHEQGKLHRLDVFAPDDDAPGFPTDPEVGGVLREPERIDLGNERA